MLVGEQRCRRPAGRPELELVSGPHAAGVVEQFAQRDAQRRLVLTGTGDVSGQRIQREARRFLAAHRPEPVHAVEDDRRNAGDGLDVVDHRRAAVQAGDGGEGWTQPRLAAAPLQRVEQRRLFAADVGARAGVHHQLQVVPRAGDVAAQIAVGVGLGDRVLQASQHRQHLTADIDEGVAGADRVRRDDHAFDQERAGWPASAECLCTYRVPTRRR